MARSNVENQKIFKGKIQAKGKTKKYCNPNWKCPHCNIMRRKRDDVDIDTCSKCGYVRKIVKKQDAIE